MKSAGQWQAEYRGDKLSGLKRTIAWSDGSLIRAIQADALRHAAALIADEHLANPFSGDPHDAAYEEAVNDCQRAVWVRVMELEG